MTPGILAAILLAASPLLRAAEPAPEAEVRVPAEFKERYEKALQYFSKGEYSRGILEWTEILRKDEEQRTAQQMIRLAREQIDKRDKDKQDLFFAAAADGDYPRALVALQTLLERDSLHPLYQSLQNRLERVLEVVERAPRSKPWQAGVKGLTGYLARDEDLALAYNGLRYAVEQNDEEPRFKKLIKIVLLENPQLAEDVVTPGMKLLDYKRFVALNHIYDGKYHLAVKTLNQVLQLEPNDVLALKRQGSAYFGLKRYQEARGVWLRALELSPNDEQLKLFINRTKETP